MPGDDDDLEEGIFDEGDGQTEAAGKSTAVQSGSEAGQDAGQDDADGEEGDEGSEAVAQPPRQQTRGEKRFQAISNEAREAKAQVSRLEQMVEQLRQERYQPPALDPELVAQQERELLAVMTPEERTEHRLKKAEKDFKDQLRGIEARQTEAIDKAAFDAKATVDPRYKKYASEVEKKVAELRRSGQSAPREAILRFMLGDMILNKAPKAGADPKKAAADRVRAQQVRSVNGRGDVPATRGKDASLAKRLENVRI